MKVEDILKTLNNVDIIREKCWAEQALTDNDLDQIVGFLDHYRDILLNKEVDI